MLPHSLTLRDIIGLLAKLKAATPDYPTHLLLERKAAFLKQAITIKLGKPGRGGHKGGGRGGSSGPGSAGTLGGASAAQGILLQAVIGVWIIAAMLTAAYVFRDQIIHLLQDNGIVVEITQAPSADSPLPVIESPAIEAPFPEITTPPGTATPGTLSDGETPPGTLSDSQEPSGTDDDSGLHIGQTPGTPNVPNQDKPKPDKPKPDKPDPPNKPNEEK